MDRWISSKIRHDYWRTITERFCEAYSKQIGQWCEKNGIAFTGHYLLENDLGAATRLGGAIMPHYCYEQLDMTGYWQKTLSFDVRNKDSVRCHRIKSFCL